MRQVPNAFWRYSLKTYRLPGVEAACLALQDRCATDTNLLLYCCWIAATGRTLDNRTLRRAMACVARWQADVIRPLRQARRALKAAPRALPQGWADDLRKRIGAVELDMEYLEQCALFALARTLPSPARPRPPRAAAQASIARYLALLAVPATAPDRRHGEALLDACWPLPPEPEVGHG
jgi:uncharacterized protein (TIGR02444 family)